MHANTDAYASHAMKCAWQPDNQPVHPVSHATHLSLSLVLLVAFSFSRVVIHKVLRIQSEGIAAPTIAQAVDLPAWFGRERVPSSVHIVSVPTVCGRGVVTTACEGVKR